MIGEPQVSRSATSYEKRRHRTEQRLRQALERLVTGTPNHPSLQERPYRLNITTLACEARVSRNTIYANHRAILDSLNDAGRRAPKPARRMSGQETAELRALIEQLQQQKRQLATENAALLKRAVEAEKTVTRLEKQNAKLVHDLGVSRQLIALPERQ